MRKLAIGCGAFSLAVFLAHGLLPAAWLFPLALGLALSGIALVPLRRRWLLPAILALCGMAAGLYAYGMAGILTLDRAHELDGKTVSTQLRVLTVPERGEGWTRAEVRLTEGAKLRGLLYDHSGALDEALPGDLVVGSFRLRAADTRYGERYDNDPARGIFLTIDAHAPPELRRDYCFSPRGMASVLNARLSARIRTLFPGDTAAFFRALLLGDKSELYEDDALYVSLSRAGLMHMVAVSGMHVAYLVAMLRSLLGNTRRMALLSILMIWFFVLLTGGSPSAVRAAIMQTTVLLAPLLERENDPPTSLLFALAVLLLHNPYAAGSVSLQLSFTALAGLLIFGEPLREQVLCLIPKRLPYKLRHELASNLSNSLSVLVLSTPLIGLYFGTASVISPVTNLLCLWAVPICFCGGYLSCLASLCSLTLGRALAWLVAWPARWIAGTAAFLSRPDFSCLYLCLKANILWLLLVYMLFAIAFILWRQGWLRWVLPTGLAVFCLFVLLTATRLYYGNLPGMMTAVDVGQGQSLAVFAGESTVVVDCGNINSRDNAGDRTGGYLRSRGRERIDCLVLTHLHTDHADGVLRLMELLPVEELVIAAEIEDPNALLPALRAAAERHGTRLRLIDSDTTLAIGPIRLELFAPSETGSANERCLSARIGVNGFELLTTGDSDWQTERQLLAKHDLSGTELLIVGHHGSKYACSRELLEVLGGETAIISVGYNNFGHPTEETLARLAQSGYTVYRTDEDGTVEIRVP